MANVIGTVDLGNVIEGANNLFKGKETTQLEIVAKADAAQLEVTKVEASNTNWFVAGWRPFIGWVCGIGLVYSFLFQPVVNGLGGNFPSLDGGELSSLLVGMLGMGGLRTFERYQNVHRN